MKQLGLFLALGLTVAVGTADAQHVQRIERRSVTLPRGIEAQRLASRPARPNRSLQQNTLILKGDELAAAIRCGTPEPTAIEKEMIAARLGRYATQERNATAPAALRTITLVLVMIHDGSDGYLSLSTLNKQIDVLNTAYKSLGYRFTVLDGTVFTFDEPGCYYLDPDSDAEYFCKPAIQEELGTNGFEYLHFYVSALDDGLLGYATFPWWLEDDPELDGVVVLNDSLPGGSAAPYNLGDTATHEIGHWFGLYHTFEQGDFADGCSGPGDFVSDTPAEREPAFGCPKTRDSCRGGGKDPVQNFMDYSDDKCMNKFSKGQTTRAKQAVNEFRYDVF